MEEYSRIKNISVRTMNSDLQSIKDQGGGEPQPYVPQESPKGPEQKPKGGGAFQPPQVEPTKPAASPSPAEPPKEPPKETVVSAGPPRKPNKKLFIIILAVLIVIALAVIAYFFVVPRFGGEEETLPLEEIAPPAPEVEAPPVEEVTPPEEEVAPPKEVPETGVPAEFHVSLFATPTDTTVFVEPETLDIAGIKSGVTLSPTEVPLFREVVLRDADGFLIPFQNYIGLFAPTVFTGELTQKFEEDATLFTYTDSSATWLGFAAQLTEGEDQAAATAEVAAVERALSEVANFFIEAPGNAGDWSDGSTGGVTSRYVRFGTEGAAFNYGWSGNKLIVGTSYPAFQEAVSRL